MVFYFVDVLWDNPCTIQSFQNRKEQINCNLGGQ